MRIQPVKWLGVAEREAEKPATDQSSRAPGLNFNELIFWSEEMVMERGGKIESDRLISVGGVNDTDLSYFVFENSFGEWRGGAVQRIVLVFFQN